MGEWSRDTRALSDLGGCRRLKPRGHPTEPTEAPAVPLRAREATCLNTETKPLLTGVSFVQRAPDDHPRSGLLRVLLNQTVPRTINHDDSTHKGEPTTRSPLLLPGICLACDHPEDDHRLQRRAQELTARPGGPCLLHLPDEGVSWPPPSSRRPQWGRLSIHLAFGTRRQASEKRGSGWGRRADAHTPEGPLPSDGWMAGPTLSATLPVTLRVS